uniref:Uncharacterized protein n=1 Tax=viral metagenome TaxID=1070528 RepID=A0A6C0LCQ9_9ZZZZ
MFEQKIVNDEVLKPVLNDNNNKYKNIINSIAVSTSEDDSNAIDQMLEMEKQHNKNEQWNKLDKTVKIQKLHQYAEKYGKDNSLPIKDIKSLKVFFVSCLDGNKLQKTKDVVYDKASKEINAIPALHFNQVSRSYTLRITDSKRVSTLKSLTPKRITEKNTQDIENL